MGRAKKPTLPRKLPVQERSKQTVACILEGAARLFHAQGFDATTNRIADAAGVGIGTLYEYFPNKESLLVALAERHLEEAERGITSALGREGDAREFLAELQTAIVASHRYPSQAIGLVADPEVASALRAREHVLRKQVMQALVARARVAQLSEPELRARAVFGVIGELSSRTAYEATSSEEHRLLAEQFLEMAVAYLESKA